ncbi:MAG: hypothetical protein SPL50_01675 [Alloprevotella sp.]|nr:hypothetical protein [Alloprevotella sp.]
MQKTQQLVNNPVSEEALELTGFYDGEHEPDAKVFPDFKDKMTGTTLKNWLKAAGITKHITFHCAQHFLAACSMIEHVKYLLKDVIW